MTNSVSAIRVLMLACMFASAAFSQTAQLTGTVVDQTGSVVPLAKLTAINIDTGVARSTVTNTSGSYLITALLPGSYRVTTEAAGFKQVNRERISLEVDQVARLDFTLPVGESRETVSVEATAILLDAATSAVGTVVENKQIADLPLSGRNPVDLLGLTAGIRLQSGFGGVISLGGGTTQSGAWSGFSFNGGIAGANPMLVEGLSLDSAVMNLPSYVPPVDATQEFRAQTSTFSAEYGRTTGAVINFSIKSGTNQYHGSAYDYWRNRELNAKNFFQNRNNQAKPAFNQHQYGGAIGGPIKRDKTFFFANFEEYSVRNSSTSTLTVPTAQQKAGDFSDTRTAAGAMVVIADPLTSVQQPNGSYLRTAFPGNRVPADRQSTVAKNVAKVWPEPNLPGVQFTRVQNYAGISGSRNNQHNLVGKLDHNINARWKVFGTYAKLWDNPITANPWPYEVSFARLQDDGRHHATISAVAVFSPTLIGEFRTGFARIVAIGVPGALGFDVTTLGFPKLFADSTSIRSFPQFSVSGMQGFGSAGANIGRFNTWGERASITKVNGSHTIKFGADYRVQQMNHLFQNTFLPNFNFTNQFTSLSPTVLNANSGIPMASFMLGYVDRASAAKSPAFANQRKYAAFFIQDDWKVTRKLTLNFGVDYSLEFPITERFDRKMWFDETAQLPISNTVGIPLRGGFQFANKDQRAPYDLYKRQLGPRVGVGYMLSTKTTIRSAFGLFWIPANLSEVVGGTRAPAWELSTQMLASLDSGVTPYHTLDNPYPVGLQEPPGSGNGLNSLIGQTAAANHRFYHTGYMGQWNFNIQREVMRDAVLQVTYAGSTGVGLPAGYAAQSNQLADQYLSLGPQLQQLVANPFLPLGIKVGVFSAPLIQRAQLLRPFPQFDTLFDEGNPVGHSSYHSFQLQHRQRFSGSVVTAAYTISKSISDLEARFDTGTTALNAGFINNYNRRQSRSLSAYDIPQRFVFSYTYEIPFGKGNRFLNNLGWLNTLVDGWSFNGIYTAQSGTPLGIVAQTNLTGNLNAVTDVYGTFVSNAAPNNNGKSAKITGNPRLRLNQWFDTSTFSQPAAFTYGTHGRTSPDVRVDGTNNLDVSLYKDNRFGPDGRFAIQIRGEAFNLANHARFGSPNTTLGNNTFGTISSQGNNPRQIQLALRFKF